MSRSRNARLALLAVPLMLAACGGQGEEQAAPDAVDEAAVTNETQAPGAVEPPPMVTSSPAYRCEDGRALYVDIMTDDSFVNVRDSRQDIPVRLDRNPESGSYEAEGRSLSGTGDTIRYSAPDRPEQGCRIGAV